MEYVIEYQYRDYSIADEDESYIANKGMACNQSLDWGTPYLNAITVSSWLASYITSIASPNHLMRRTG